MIISPYIHCLINQIPELTHNVFFISGSITTSQYTSISLLLKYNDLVNYKNSGWHSFFPSYDLLNLCLPVDDRLRKCSALISCNSVIGYMKICLVFPFHTTISQIACDPILFLQKPNHKLNITLPTFSCCLFLMAVKYKKSVIR